MNPGVSPENTAKQGFVLCPSRELNLRSRQTGNENINDLTFLRWLLFGGLCFKQSGSSQYAWHGIVAFMTGVFI